MFWLSAAKWIGTGAGVSGAIMIALNLGLWCMDSLCSSCRPRYGDRSRWVQREPSLAGAAGRIHGHQRARSLALGRELKP